MVKVVLLFTIVVPVHVIFTIYVYPPSSTEMVGRTHLSQLAALKSCIGKEANTIIFLGDSVNFSYAPSDRDKRRISEMLQDSLPDFRVVAIDHRAYHMGVYRGFVSRLTGSANKPNLVIIPVNLRSITTHWVKNPSWQFVDLQRYLLFDGVLFRVFFRPMRSFKIYRDSTLSEVAFSRTPLYDGDIKVGTVKDYQSVSREDASTRNTKAMITYYYMEKLQEKNPRACDLVAISQMVKQTDLKVLFYITPIDYQKCDTVLGDRFSQRIKENKAIVRNLLEREKIDVLDLSFSLPSDGFYYRSQYPDEHLNEKGRKAVASMLRDSIATRKHRNEKGQE